MMLISFSALGQESIGIKNYTFADRELNTVNRFELLYSKQLNSRMSHIISAGRYHISDTSNVVNYNKLGYRFIYKNIEDIQSNELNIGIGYLVNDTLSNVFTYDLRYTINRLKNVTVNFISERDIIDIPSAIVNNFIYHINGVTTDVKLGKSLTTTVGYSLQIMDNLPNTVYRNIYYANADLPLKYNFGVFVKNRMMNSEQTSEYFFQPNVLNFHMAGIYKSFILFSENMVIKPSFSAGVQRLNTVDNFIYEPKLEIRGWIQGKVNYTANIRYSNAVQEFGVYGFIMSDIGIKYVF